MWNSITNNNSRNDFDLIFDHIKEKNYKKIKELVLNDERILYHSDHNDMIPMIIAIKKANVTLVKMLLELGYNVNYTYYKCSNALNETIYSFGYGFQNRKGERLFDILKLLLKYGADPNICSEDQYNIASSYMHIYHGSTPLMMSIRHINSTWNAKVIRLLISYGADLKLSVNQNILVEAMKSYYDYNENKDFIVKCIKLLIDSGANVEYRSQYKTHSKTNHSPLTMAVLKKFHFIVVYLIEKFQVQVECDSLYEAASTGDMDMIHILLQYIDVNDCPEILFHVGTVPNNLNAFEFLIKKGINIYQTNKNGMTIIQHLSQFFPDYQRKTIYKYILTNNRRHDNEDRDNEYHHNAEDNDHEEHDHQEPDHQEDDHQEDDHKEINSDDFEDEEFQYMIDNGIVKRIEEHIYEETLTSKAARQMFTLLIEYLNQMGLLYDYDFGKNLNRDAMNIINRVFIENEKYNFILSTRHLKHDGYPILPREIREYLYPYIRSGRLEMLKKRKVKQANPLKRRKIDQTQEDQTIQKRRVKQSRANHDTMTTEELLHILEELEQEEQE